MKKMLKILSNLTKIAGNKRASKRVGRGYGSGKGGHTVGRGTKGQKSRSGGKVKNWFEGGQTPITKSMPYTRGFTSVSKNDVTALNLSDIVLRLKKETLVTLDWLKKNKIVNIKEGIPVKILGSGKLEKKVDFRGFLYSQKAREKIEKAGGKAE